MTSFLLSLVHFEAHHTMSIRIETTTLVILGVVVASASPAHADWPEFRGPLGDGTARHADLPTEWSRQQNVNWRTELPGEGWSSPVVIGNKIYLTAAVPRLPTEPDSGFDLALLIVDADSGELLRQVTLFGEGPDAPRIHQKNSRASATPVFDGKRLYVHFGHHGTACTTLDGEVIWKNDSLTYRPVHGNGGSPVVVAGKVIFSRDGAETSEITALDASTGELAWRTPRNVEVRKTFSFCTPLVLDDGKLTQVIVPGSNVVQSVDPETGEERWRVTYDGYSVVPRPIYHTGLVFVSTGYDRATLLAIDPSGRGDVTETHLRWRATSGIPKTPSLVGFEDKVAMVSDDGIASCYDAETGKRQWIERIGGDFSASPLLAGNRLYLVSEGGVCTVLDVSGTPSEIAVNDLGERTLASPAVIDDDLLIRTAEALYRVGR